MTVLVVHNYYRSSSPSGEDLAFQREHDALVAAGVNVQVHTMSNDWLAGGTLVSRIGWT